MRPREQGEHKQPHVAGKLDTERGEPKHVLDGALHTTHGAIKQCRIPAFIVVLSTKLWRDFVFFPAFSKHSSVLELYANIIHKSVFPQV